MKVAQQMAAMERGDELCREGRFDAARRAYAEVWRATKGRSGSLGNMAVYSIVEMYVDAGTPSRALPWLRKMLETRPPKDTSNFVLAGRVWFDLGDFSRAEAMFGEAFALGQRRAFQGSDPKYLAWYRARESDRARVASVGRRAGPRAAKRVSAK